MLTRGLHLFASLVSAHRRAGVAKVVTKSGLHLPHRTAVEAAPIGQRQRCVVAVLTLSRNGLISTFSVISLLLVK